MAESDGNLGARWGAEDGALKRPIAATEFDSAVDADGDSEGTGDSRAHRPEHKVCNQMSARKTWSDEEHAKFVEALKLYNREWRSIADYIGTKTVSQIRSHAQKYFLKIQRNKTNEYVPPARPRRISQNLTAAVSLRLRARSASMLGKPSADVLGVSRSPASESMDVLHLPLRAADGRERRIHELVHQYFDNLPLYIVRLMTTGHPRPSEARVRTVVGIAFDCGTPLEHLATMCRRLLPTERVVVARILAELCMRQLERMTGDYTRWMAALSRQRLPG